MNAGELLPDEVVLKLVGPKIAELKDENWLLDGFPRKASQAVLLDQLLEGRPSDALNLVVNLAVPDEVILGRIEDRWIHAPSGRMYNNSFNPPKVAGKDDLTGEPLVRRPDDNAETFAKRLASFHAENNPLLAHYKNSTVNINGSDLAKLVTLAGRTSDEIWPQLIDLIEERYLLPSNTS